jgi:hypothetical protein
MMTTRKTERSQGPDCKSVTNLHSSPLLADGDLTEPPFVYALLRLLFSIQPSPHQPLLSPFAWREREVRSSRRQGARNSSTAEAGAGGRGKREARGSQPASHRLRGSRLHPDQAAPRLCSAFSSICRRPHRAAAQWRSARACLGWLVSFVWR